jgi:hypothetical protein
VVLVLALLVAGCSSRPPAAGDAGTPPSGPGASPPLHSIPALLPHSLQAASPGSEPSLLADRNGKFLWIGDTSGTSYSDDNGTSWHPMGYNGNIGLAFGDGAALAQDDVGRLYAAVLHDNRIDVVRSDDGRSFSQSTLAAGLFATVDRPWIGAHGDGEVALFYIDAEGLVYYPAFSGHCSRSTDKGVTFADQMVAATTPQGGKAFYDSAGRFYYSQDNGAVRRFDSTCLAGGKEIQLVDGLGLNNMIQADADGTDVYMAATTGGHHTITVGGRRDDGSTRTLDVSPPELATNVYATVAARGGDVAVAWYGSTADADPSADGFTGDFNVYVSVIHDFWGDALATTMQLTATPNHQGTICYGGVGCTGNRGLLDYFMIDYDKWGGLHVAYVDDVAGSGTYYAHIPPEAIAGKPKEGGAPRAAFTATVAGGVVSVDASGSQAAPGASLASYAWDWGDGATGEGASAQHAYGSYGAYAVTLKVTDSAGRTGTASRNLLVDAAPVGTSPTSSAAPTTSKAPTTGPATASTGAGTSKAGKSSSAASTSGSSGAPGLPLPVLLALLAVAALLAQGISRGPLSRKR